MNNSFEAVFTARQELNGVILNDKIAHTVNEDFLPQSRGQLLDLASWCASYKEVYTHLKTNWTPDSPGYWPNYNDILIYGKAIRKAPIAHIGRALFGRMPDQQRSHLKLYKDEALRCRNIIVDMSTHSPLDDNLPHPKVIVNGNFVPPRIYKSAIRATENILVQTLTGSQDSLPEVNLNNPLSIHHEIIFSVSRAARWIIFCDDEDKKQPLV